MSYHVAVDIIQCILALKTGGSGKDKEMALNSSSSSLVFLWGGISIIHRVTHRHRHGGIDQRIGIIKHKQTAGRRRYLLLQAQLVSYHSIQACLLTYLSIDLCSPVLLFCRSCLLDGKRQILLLFQECISCLGSKY